MATIADLLRLMPLVWYLFPELIKGFQMGKIIPLFKVDPMTDAQVVEALSRRLKAKRRDDNFDETHVIKVSEVRECVDHQLEKGVTFIAEALKYAIKDILSGGGKTAGPMEEFINGIMDCVRENALRHDTIRIKGRVRGPYARPAVGHGHGRGKF